MSFSSDIPLQSNQLPISIDYPSPKDEKNFINTLSLDRKRISDSMNTKTGGIYQLQEQANFNQYFTTGNPQVNRNAYRSVYDVVNLNGGNIGAGATVAFPHNINGLSYSTLIYASCTSTDPIFFTVVYPYAYLDAVNLNFTNPLGTALTSVIFVAEYLKN